MIRIILAISALLAPVTPSAPDRVDSDGLMRDLRVLSADDMAGRSTGTDGSVRARNYIERRLAEAGVQVHRTPFRFDAPPRGSLQGANVWALVRGSEYPDQVIVVSAHYDHLGVVEGQIYNGADDNASGTAAMLAIAGALQRSPPRHSVLLVAFDAEELGLFGSRMFVQAPPVPLDRILLDINLDMVSRNDRGWLSAAGPRIYPALRPVVMAAAQASPVSLRLGDDFRRTETSPGRSDMTLRSDQAAFGLVGIPFVFFSTGSHRDYHRPSDDAERVVAPFYSGVVTTVLDVFRRLDADHTALETARRAGNHPHF